MSKKTTTPLSVEKKINFLKKELAETKEKLKEQEAFFKSITESTLAGYWIWNIKEDTMYLSPQLKAMLGYEDHELENSGETINKLMHASDLPDTYALLGKHLESNGKIPFETEVRYKHKNKSIVWVICTGNIVKRDKDGNPEVMIGCHLDNTELKKAQGTQKYVEELERKNAEMEQFAYVASHDLQEPLNTIKGFINLLNLRLGDLVDEEIATYLEHIDQGANRMTNLIKGLLEYSRIGQETVIARINIWNIVQDVLADLNFWINETKAEFEIGQLPSIMAYDIEMRVLFQNLIGNALKFRSEEPPKIKINAKKQQDHWLFTVADNGIGVDPEYSEKIFKLFQRLHPKEKYKGSGLGLAQCYKIVTELHKGKIWVEKNKDKGSVFCFTIPIGI